MIDLLLDHLHFQQCFQNCQRNADSNSAGSPERNDDVGVVSLSKLHDTSFGLSVLCNVFVISSMSANQKDLEENGEKVQKPGESKLMFWPMKLFEDYQYKLIRIAMNFIFQGAN